MLGKTFVEERIGRALQLSEGDGCQVILQAQDQALTRFANNFIHQNVHESNSTITIKAVIGQKSGMAATNDLSDDSLAKTAKRALMHAKSSQADPDLPGLASPQNIEPVDAYDEETALCEPVVRAAGIGEICAQAKASELTAFGAFSTAVAEIAIANSNGLLAYHIGTRATISTTIAGDNGSSM